MIPALSSSASTTQGEAKNSGGIGSKSGGEEQPTASGSNRSKQRLIKVDFSLLQVSSDALYQ